MKILTPLAYCRVKLFTERGCSAVSSSCPHALHDVPIPSHLARYVLVCNIPVLASNKRRTPRIIIDLLFGNLLLESSV